MGLDISAQLDNQEELYENEEFLDILSEPKLSRTFCNFIHRQGVVEHSELNQLGELIKIDIQFFYDMSEYASEDEMYESIEHLKDEPEEYEERKQNYLDLNKKVENNIFEVQEKLKQFIEKLSEIENLPSKLKETDFDTLDNAFYFSEFNKNLSEGYIGNNFGHDLRNLLDFIEFGIKNNSKTVYFEFG
ncbi:hypothetical protein [Aureivirga sp. CE67]|uniref:hypothetical protein n=1 Tax=Aureivirga sp. CE67 TaxID=1788983 RepID=UPI0018CA693D|nr:hypothetical protein [Aureivirga sp. CE67]